MQNSIDIKLWIANFNFFIYSMQNIKSKKQTIVKFMNMLIEMIQKIPIIEIFIFNELF
jgi:hypothetical protein